MKMVAYHHFHITVQEYYRRGKQNLFPHIFKCPHPGCLYSNKLRSHGFYRRNVLTFHETFVIYIKRYYCPSCRRTVSLLPSFLAPRFQYTPAFIFFTLFRRIINNLPLAQIAQKLNALSGRAEFSPHHIRFYRRRFSENLPLLIGFFGSKEIVFVHADLPLLIIQISRYSLPRFSLEYFSFNARHFLSKR